jgi:predicted phosphoadenosine phosphosulfate sulfurtransferase
VPKRVAESCRAPSYKALAIAILKNDHTLKSLGFGCAESLVSELLIAEKKQTESPQQKLI